MNLVPGATPAQVQNAEIDTPGRSLRTWRQRHAAATATRPASTARCRSTSGCRTTSATCSRPRRSRPSTSSTNNFDADHGHGGRRGVDRRHQVGHQRAARLGVLLPQPGRVQRQHLRQQRVRPAEGRPVAATSTAARSAGRSSRTSCSTSASCERYQERRGVAGHLRRADRADARRATSARWRRPTRPSGSSTRSPAAPAASAATQFPNYHDPAEPDQPDLRRRSWPTTRCRTRRADLNSQPASSTTTSQAARRSRNDRDNFDAQADLPALAGAQRSGASSSMLDAEVVDNFILGFDEGSLGDTRVYVGTARPHLDAQPDARPRRQLRHRTSRTRRSPGPTSATNLGLDLGIPGTNGSTIAPSGLPHFDIPSALPTGANGYDIGTTPNWMPLFRKERSYTFSSALTKVMPAARAAHRRRRRAPRAEPPARPSSAASAACAAASSSAATSPAPPGYIPPGWNELRRLPPRPAVAPGEGRAGRWR